MSIGQIRIDARETYYPKPAYFGVRNAIENYFGKAFCVKDPSGNDLVRFVHNGNVIVARGVINESYSSWTNPAIASKSFIIRDTHGDTKATIDPEGNIYLAGTVSENQGTDSQHQPVAFDVPTDKAAFVVRDEAGNVASYIDASGNLRVRGDLIVKGIPYTLNKIHGRNGTGSIDTYLTN